MGWGMAGCGCVGKSHTGKGAEQARFDKYGLNARGVLENHTSQALELFKSIMLNHQVP
jgi:hypothetical protein